MSKTIISWNSIVSITWGSQNCRGGIPDFIAIDIIIISLLILIEFKILNFEKIKKDITITIEAPA